jgi:peptide/nickel transport system substrate-binding protein
VELAGGCRYDLEQSRKLLEEAGLGDGFEFELLSSTAVMPTSPLVAAILQSDLARIGVRANIADVAPSDYYERHTTGKYEVALHQFRGANRDPNSLFLSTIPWHPQGNFSLFESAAYTGLVKEAGGVSDLEMRRSLYKEISRLILDESFVLCIAPVPALFAFGSRVRGFAWNVEGHPNFERVSLV